MHHLAAYFLAIGQTANTDITALNDDVLTRTNGHFQLARDMDLMAGCVMSATLNRARLNSPTLRVVSPQFIYPPEVSLTPTDHPNMAWWLDSPFRLKAGEEIALEATSGLACGTENLVGLIWITEGLQPVPAGDIYNARWTSTTACVANTWTTLTITMDQGLPPGVWALVGSTHQSTTGKAHRWIIPNQTWRPGALSQTALGNATHRNFEDRRLGLFGTFVNTIMPQVQVLANTTDNAHVGLMQLVKIG